MRSVIYLGAAAFTTLMVMPTHATAAVLFNYDFGGSGGARTNPPLYVTVSHRGPDFSSSDFLFQTPWTTSDIGTTRIEDGSSNTVAFNNMVGYLTNGTTDGLSFNERLGSINGSGASVSMNEAEVVFGDPADPRIDLHGYTIDSFSLKLNSLSISTVSGFTSYSYNATFSASGSIPEPAALSLGALTLVLSRRRVRR